MKSNINEVGWRPITYVNNTHARLRGNSGVGAVSAIGTSLNVFLWQKRILEIHIAGYDTSEGFPLLDLHLIIVPGRRFSLKMIFLWKEQGLTRNAWWN